MGAKKFAPWRCVIAKARKSSPSALKTPKIRRLCACWASFFAERPVEAPCWANFVAPTGAVPRSCWRGGALQVAAWGFCAMRSPLAARRRRVGGLDGAIPPVGGGAAAPRGGVAAKVQTHWVKNGEKGPFWRNGSALWRIRCRAWCVVRTRTRYCEPKPAISHANPLLRVWAGLPRLVLAG